MKSFKITVNGTVYNVDVEETTQGAQVQPSAPSAPVEKAKPAAAPAPASATPTTPKAAPAGAEKVVSPLPGNVLKILVKEGSTIKRGDPAFVIEAMKMENEISSTVSGKIATINVAVGATIGSGDVLMTVIAG